VVELLEDLVMYRRRTLIASVAASVALTLGWLGLTAAPAFATPTLVTCAGSNEAHYSPGLTNDEQMTTLSGADTGNCTSLTHPSLTSVADAFGGTLPLSCTTVFSVQDIVETLYWNGGTTLTSTWTFDATFTIVNSNIVVTLSGPITGGVLAGANLSLITVVATAELAGCSQPGGVEDLNGASTWVFSSLF
jgi:hypothetical protein